MRSWSSCCRARLARPSACCKTASGPAVSFCYHAKVRSHAPALFVIAGLVHAQQQPPMHSESTSTVDLSTAADGSQTVEIRNITHEVSERLLLRKTTRSKQVLGDIGMEAS